MHIKTKDMILMYHVVQLLFWEEDRQLSIRHQHLSLGGEHLQPYHHQEDRQ